MDYLNTRFNNLSLARENHFLEFSDVVMGVIFYFLHGPNNVIGLQLHPSDWILLVEKYIQNLISRSPC